MFSHSTLEIYRINVIKVQLKEIITQPISETILINIINRIINLIKKSAICGLNKPGTLSFYTETAQTDTYR